MFISMQACNNNSKDINKWTDEQVNEWFQSSVWSTQLEIKPDESIESCKRQFVKENLVNPKAWKAAYDFLKDNDLKNLPDGRYELSDDGTYATVTEYMTKEPETAKYEAHRKYIDIQYVAAGEEYIEVLPLQMIDEEQNYDENADILFFESETQGDKLYADSTRFFVFFPTDVHKPCLKIGTSRIVKKIVVKIPLS